MQNQQNITLEQLLHHLENGELIYEKKIKSKNWRDRHSFFAIVEMPALDSRFEFYDFLILTDLMTFNNNQRFVDIPFISKYFGISVYETTHLFCPDFQKPYYFGGKHLDSNATIEEVIFNLKEFLKRQK